MAAHEPRKDPRQRADALARSLTDLLAPIVNDAGLHLESVETTRAGKYSVVRVFVDLVDGPGDLDLDALGPVTAAISQALDEADPVKGQYTLEVSTPGAERELTTLRHFRRAVGHSARVRTADDELTGVVTAAEEDDEALALLPRLGGRIEGETSDDGTVDADLARGGALDDGAHQRDPRAEPRPPKPVEPPRWPASRERSAPGRVCGDTEDLP